MKILGIIAEYNPMHTGHIYHINEAKKITFRLFVPLVNEATFKVNYYTTIDGIVHTFN